MSPKKLRPWISGVAGMACACAGGLNIGALISGYSNVPILSIVAIAMCTTCCIATAFNLKMARYPFN